jgi:hypothetical protein
MKTSKIKEVVSVSEPYGQYKVLYHKLIMENGDKLDIGKTKKQEVGYELTYEFTGDLGQHEFTKAKSVNPMQEQFNKSDNKNDNKMSKADWEAKDNRKELVIARQVALYNATAYCNADKCSPEEILETANMFCTWIVSGQIKSNLHDKIPF